MEPFIIERTPVESSYIASVGYDAERSIVAVEFKDGSVWHYAGVSAALWEALLDSESKGRFFGAQIRGRFEALKMTGPCPNCGGNGMVGETCGDCGTAVYEREPARVR